MASPAVQAPSLAGHGQTALGPRPIPWLSRLCVRACGVARSAPNRLSRVRPYPLPQVECGDICYGFILHIGHRMYIVHISTMHTSHDMPWHMLHKVKPQALMRLSVGNMR